MEEKRIEAQRAKPRKSILVIEALIGEEEHTGGKKRKNKEKQGTNLPPSYFEPFGHLLRPVEII